MITVCTPASVSRAAEVSIRNSDSGVVIRMSGGLVISSRRRFGRGVAGAHPDADVRRRLPAPLGDAGDAGQRRAQVALDVDGQRLQRRDVEHPGARPGGVRGRAASRSIAHRNAASVLPEPVGAMTSVLSPSAIAVQACACAGVGAAKVPANHSARQRAEAVQRIRRGIGGSGHPTMVPRPTDKVDMSAVAPDAREPWSLER